MAAETATLCCTLLFVFLFVSAEQKNITAECGQNVTLPCGAPNNSYNILIVEWSRADLETVNVLVYRDGKPVPDSQHPSFKNRVDLQDRQMKDGNVSVILKDVTVNDTGTYECRVFIGETDLWKLISIIYLRVVAPPGPGGGTTEDGGKKDGRKEDGGKEDGGKEDGSVGLIVGLSVPALLLVAVAGFLIYRKHKQSQDPYLPPVELQPV